MRIYINQRHISPVVRSRSLPGKAPCIPAAGDDNTGAFIIIFSPTLPFIHPFICLELVRNADRLPLQRSNLPCNFSFERNNGNNKLKLKDGFYKIINVVLVVVVFVVSFVFAVLFVFVVVVIQLQNATSIMTTKAAPMTKKQ